MITDEWAHQLNELCYQMDEIVNSVHPTAWGDTELVELEVKWRVIVSAPIQDTLFELEELDAVY